MTLEKMINMTNIRYRNKGVADIRKIPTPIQITGSKGNLVTGRKEKGELCDYIGVVGGRAIAFEAKEAATHSFPLANIQDHQYEFLKSWHNNGAVTFLIIYMKKWDKTYFVSFEVLSDAWNESKQGGRKSIPYEVLEECPIIESRNGYVLDYIKILEEYVK